MNIHRTGLFVTRVHQVDIPLTTGQMNVIDVLEANFVLEMGAPIVWIVHLAHIVMSEDVRLVLIVPLARTMNTMGRNTHMHASRVLRESTIPMKDQELKMRVLTGNFTV